MNKNIESKYNPDINKKYEDLINNRNNRNVEYSTKIWKPIIDLNDKSIDIKKSEQRNINLLYEKELLERSNEQKLIEERQLKKIDTPKLEEPEIIVPNNFDDLKKLSLNVDKSTINLDELLNCIKKL